MDLTTPAALTERYTPGEYRPVVTLRHSDAEDMFDIDAVLLRDPVTYQRGRPVVEGWNRGVFGPSFSGESWIARQGNVMGFELYMFGDQGLGHYGSSNVDAMTITLSRDGILLGQWPGGFDDVVVPAEPGSYELAATATHSVSPLSTRVSSVWRFRSGQTDRFQPLPVMAVRFAPDLDQHNRAPAGVPFAVPVEVQQQAGADAGGLRALSVQVSYDDGASWRPVPLLGTGPDRTAMLLHPHSNGYVSLRATAVDDRGNTVEQTIIHAYALTR